MKEIKKLKIYAVKKNEDADPYVSNSFFAVADGLGGSGATRHLLKEKEVRNLEHNLIKVALSEFSDYHKETSQPTQLEKYIKKLFEPMVDESPDTSALWASRIVMARFVLAMTERKDFHEWADERVRGSLVEFLEKGLLSVKKAYDLKPGMSGQMVLPTTFVAAKYKTSDDGVAAEVIWAGDSRCYALVPGEGLKQLSVDDENSGGAITNLFSAEGGKKTKLNYQKYKLPEKSILFAVSDGVFDPFSPIDNIGVEASMLGTMQKSDSVEQWEQNLLAHFKGILHDDTTIALVIFGFESFKEVKEAFAEREKLATQALNDYYDCKDVLESVSESEENANEYVSERTSQRIDKVSEKLADIIFAGGDDIALIPELRKAENDARDAHKAGLEKIKKQREMEKMAEIKAAMAECLDSETQYFADKFPKDLTEDALEAKEKIKIVLKVEKTLKKKENKISQLQVAVKTAEVKLKEKREAGKVQIKHIERRIGQLEKGITVLEAEKTKYKKAYYRPDKKNVYKKTTEKDMSVAGTKVADLEQRICKHRQVISNLRYLIEEIEFEKSYLLWGLTKDYFFADDEKIVDKTREIVKKIKEAKREVSRQEAKVKRVQRDDKKLKENYQKALHSLDKYAGVILSNYKSFFNANGIRKFGLYSFCAAVASELPKEALTDAIKSTLEDQKVMTLFVAALAKNYDKQSAIYEFYNKSRVGSFQAYHALVATGAKERILKVKTKIDSLLPLYENVEKYAVREGSGV